MKRVLALCLLAALCGCSALYPPRNDSTQKRINATLQEAAAIPAKSPMAPVPNAVSNALLPPLRGGIPRSSSRQLEPRFDLVVTDAPMNEVLMAIVSGTRYSILVKPKAALSALAPSGAPVGTAAPANAKGAERLTVNLKDVTVFEALDAIREIYGYEYTQESNRIYVQPPELKTALYQVNYILGQRRGVSDLQVIAGSSSGAGGSGGGPGIGSTVGAGASTGSYASIQSSALSTISKSDVWGEMEDALRTMLGCQIAKDQPKGGAGGASAGGNSSRADVSFVGESQLGERPRGVDGCSEGRAMSVNPMSGTILVRGMPHELRLVDRMLRAMQGNIERQVIIEAKIIDVELNAGAQQGINWAAFGGGRHQASVGANTSLIDGTTGNTSGSAAGTVNAGTSLGALLGTQMLGLATPNAFSAGLGVALQLTDFSALVNFLQTQGQVHVLSNPRIATLNNQKAVLKVGSEESFVTNASGGQITAGTGGSAATTTNPTITYQPFFSGIALDVTPQIDDSNRITLHVHSMVNSIAVRDKLAIISTSGDRTLPFAVNSISETDSVVKTRDGQMIVIGGLMTESGSDNRAKVPGLGDLPGPGSLFSRGEQKSVKRELVILLRPTVVKGDSTWSSEISGAQGRLERMDATLPSITPERQN